MTVDPRFRVVGPSDRGSASIWAIAIILCVSATACAALLWLEGMSTRHAAQQTADQAALAAAASAVHGLEHWGDPDLAHPCAAAAKVAGEQGAALRSCACEALDCTVRVERTLPAGGFVASLVPGPLRAAAVARAGPVGSADSQ
jgi:secretion/DNA translocation related TadE-like protein